MRKVVLFIAMSLDGYISDNNGDINWLSGHSESEDDLSSYSEFIKNIDTVIMGWNTYNQIVTELSPDEWVYDNLKSYVITHRNIMSEEKIVFTGQNPCNLINELNKKQGKDIWICGGANIIWQLMQCNLIDYYYISIIPTLLGSGIRLFETLSDEIKLKLIHTKTYNGITDLVYKRR